MKFDPTNGDPDEFFAVRDTLLAEYRTWAAEHLGPRPDGLVDADLLLNWRYDYSTGDLGAFSVADIREFLLEWCPRKVGSAPEFWLAIIAGVEGWLLFLINTGRWSGGDGRLLAKALDKIVPEFLDAMADPSKAGMAKGLMANPAFADVDINDPATLQAAMDAFNALPFEERKAATDQGMADVGLIDDEPLELPTLQAADLAVAHAQAAEAPIVVQLAAVREYLGAGKALTATGNLKLVDARALLELVPTDDIADHSIGDREYKLRSADNLPHLQYLIEAAKEAKAIRQHANKLVGVQRWAKHDAVTQVHALLDAMLWIGPIFGRGRTYWRDDEAALLEDGLMHWMVTVLVTGEHHVDEIVDQAQEIIHRRREEIERNVEDVLDVAERCGLVTRSETREEKSRYFDNTYRRGGVLHITELGRVILPPYLERVGYVIATMESLADMSASELLERLADDVGFDAASVWSSWAPGLAAPAKVDALVTALVAAPTARQRSVWRRLLPEAGDALGAVRSLLETPLGGYAEMVLLASGLLEEEEEDRYPDAMLVPIIDTLAIINDDHPADLPAGFDRFVGDGDPQEAISDLWQVDLPETLEVLEALGRLHPNKAIAKAARKAVFQHRSRYPR